VEDSKWESGDIIELMLLLRKKEKELQEIKDKLKEAHERQSKYEDQATGTSSKDAGKPQHEEETNNTNHRPEEQQEKDRHASDDDDSDEQHRGHKEKEKEKEEEDKDSQSQSNAAQSSGEVPTPNRNRLRITNLNMSVDLSSSCDNVHTIETPPCSPDSELQLENLVDNRQRAIMLALQYEDAEVINVRNGESFKPHVIIIIAQNANIILFRGCIWHMC
jgi:hypothetical protein